MLWNRLGFEAEPAITIISRFGFVVLDHRNFDVIPEIDSGRLRSRRAQERSQKHCMIHGVAVDIVQRGTHCRVSI
jgi:hypothetical protein